LKDSITAEVVVTRCRWRRADCLSSGFFSPNRTVEGAEDQALRAQSGEIIET
jgi:hypothetical protein